MSHISRKIELNRLNFVERIKREILRKYPKYQCEKCKTKNNLTAHHIIPKAEGGKDDMSNIKILCRSCHDQEHNMVYNPTKKRKWSEERMKFLKIMIEKKHDWSIISKYFNRPEEEIKQIAKQRGLI